MPLVCFFNRKSCHLFVAKESVHYFMFWCSCFPCLQSLSIEFPNDIEYTVGGNSSLPSSLEELNLVNCLLWGNTKESLANFASLKKLKVLSVVHSDATALDEVARYLLTMPMLEKLYIRSITNVAPVVEHSALQRCVVFVPHGKFAESLKLFLQSTKSARFSLHSVDIEPKDPPRTHLMKMCTPVLFDHFSTVCYPRPSKISFQKPVKNLKPLHATNHQIETEYGIELPREWLERHRDVGLSTPSGGMLFNSRRQTCDNVELSVFQNCEANVFQQLVKQSN